MKPVTLRSIVVVVAAVTAAGASHAAIDMPKEGRFDFNFCMAGKVDYHKVNEQLGMAAYELDAAIHSNVPKGPFDLQGAHCVGNGSSIAGQWAGAGYCKVVDADGDQWMFRHEDGPDLSGKWRAVGGTGKYEGIEASATYKAVGFPPSVLPDRFNRCNRNTGTYKLR